MKEEQFEIEKEIAVLSENDKTKWKKELNLISWYGKEAKLDIREWSPEKNKCGRGITLTAEEVKALRDSLNKTELE